MAKVAIIMYMFSIAVLFSGYFIEKAYGLGLFTGITIDSLEQLISKNDINQEISVDLIFGDFIAAARVVFGIVTGDTIAAAFSIIPSFNEVWMLLVRLLFTFSSALLWAFVVAGRSL